jgi:S1-C subfamily serine protease
MRYLLALALVQVLGPGAVASAQVRCEGGPGAVVEARHGVTICANTVNVPVVTHAEPQPGVLVVALAPDSPLARAGLTTGDVIYHVHGARVTTANEVQGLLDSQAALRGLTINFWRGDVPYLVRVWSTTPAGAVPGAARELR